MKSFTPCRLWFLVLGSLACGSAGDSQNAGLDEALSPGQSTGTLKATALSFAGGGTSGAAKPLTVALAPATSSQCDPEPTASVLPSSADVQTVCFFGADSSDVPAAFIEQVVEVVGTEEFVHIRLTLNPDFVDNTYGETAIGWDGVDEGAGPAAPLDAPAPDGAKSPAPPRADGADAPLPPAPPADGADAPPPPAPPADGADAPPPPAPPADGADAPPPPADADVPPAPGEPKDGPGKEGPGKGGPGKGGPGKGGHTFDDLLGSDHAEITLLDANGAVSMHFKLDYISKSESAASGFASLGVSGGEGQLIVGEPEWVLATATSIDRNLNACSLGAFTESSPATDAAYTLNADASDWDYRVAYEIWVSTAAFGAAGFGSALIDNVHASPSKAAGNTVDVLPAPCPSNPGTPEATPEPLPVVLQNIR